MRHETLLRRSDVLLIVVDVQERLAREVVRSEQVLDRVARLTEVAAVLGLPVLLTEHNPEVFGPTVAFVEGPVLGSIKMSKMVFSCFSLADFRPAVEASGRRQLLFAGFETHICVCQTALDAVAAGYQTHVVRDACSARASSDHRAGLDKMASGGVLLPTWEMAAFELLERAGTDEFRRILPLIKRGSTTRGRKLGF